MPIGAIGGVVAGVGAIAGAGAQKSAAKKAAQTQQYTTDTNNALARDMYDRNSQNMQPWLQSGMRAQGVLNGLLYGDPVSLPGQAALTGAGYGMGGNGNALAYYNEGYPGLSDTGSYYGDSALSAYGQPALGSQYQGQGALSGNALAGTTTPQPSALSAWDQFRNSTNYQFRFNEGMKGLNASYAAKGLGQSGAAMKAALRYGQDYASNELGNYLGLLTGQANSGMAGASALAGVGQNLVSNVTQNNQAGASALANSQLAAGNATANMWNGLGNAVGFGFGMSSYGRK